jgi:competence protein ComGC
VKLISSLFATSLYLLLVGPVQAATEPTEPRGCAAKQQAIRQQIDQATAHGNARQLAGLQTALKASQAHCTDASLRKEREAKVRAAASEVEQREAQLDSARQKGDPDKIHKRNAKLAEARQEYQQALDELQR